VFLFGALGVLLAGDAPPHVCREAGQLLLLLLLLLLQKW
jgi:hypothetical protein